ncbi:hypothetical protein [Trichococcus alkaliphilus]|uniref:hypothetical protein n=1 Tax=Trichococcus alkaliphilus TaxID=2052943 RepID=UPI000D0B9BE9|nr:hypothetical protein [Trichococcus alkaliphilus]
MNIKNDMNSGKTRSNLAVINTETGEIINEVASYRTVTQQEAYQQFKQKEDRVASAKEEKEPFIFADMNNLKERIGMTELTFKQLGYYAVLTTYAGYDNVLKLSEQANVPMDKEDLKTVLKINREHTINELIKALKTAGVLTEITIDKYGKKRKSYMLDSTLLFRGAGAGNGVTDKAKIWQSNVQQAFKEGTVTASDLGLVFAVIPYVNIATNVLAYNIQESDGNKVLGIALGDLAELLGIDLKTLQRHVNGAKFNGMHIFSKSQAGSEKFIKVNPLIVYRKAGKPDVASYVEFTAKVGKPPKKGAK